MISFYPGPSQVLDKVPRYVGDAFESGILSLNHRSPEFEALMKKTVALLKSRLGVPKDFEVIFVSSATECWEIVAQSLVQTKSHHLFSGAFGSKWFDYTHKICPGAEALRFDADMPPAVRAMHTGEVICITQNETSNGSQVTNDFIAATRSANPDHLIAVDATSSMAGIRLDFAAADVWLASVQKCFGLPAGLGILLLSSRAVATARRLNDQRYYNSLPLMLDMAARSQTSYTPNVMSIYLLMRSLEDRGSMREVHGTTAKRARAWYRAIGQSRSLRPKVKNPGSRSLTVMAVETDPTLVEQIKADARKAGFLLGEGYGDLKKTTFRIANFPALKERDIARLMRFLSKY